MAFKKIQNFKTDYAEAEFTQYESTRTGMRVAVCDRKGPKVQGYFTLATEIHDDSGAPHTLEHLCFMGSKSYQYKGVLDKLATRAYSFTNAWTATDHTAYTLDTAGWAGFAQILPVYLEHVLVPTLTDQGCYTEVWHIDGSGHDAGVVYSEMQGVQNNQTELMELAARRTLYPEGDGFRYETGGMMENLRVLTADRIRMFHKDMYQPKNLRVVLIGEIDHKELLDILDKFELSIANDVPRLDEPFKRPWIDSKQTPPLAESVIKTVEFPEEDESMGEVMVGLFGPPFRDNLEGTAIDVLIQYLSGSTVSLLENTMVEKEELCSSVYLYQENRPKSVIWMSLSSVATDQLATVEKRLFELLQEAVTKPLDMDYMTDCIKRYHRSILSTAETSNSLFRDPMIEDHLFGDREGVQFEDSIRTMNVFSKLLTWGEQEWKDLLSKYFAHNTHVSILGTPSKKLSNKLKTEENARVKLQREKLGDEGMKKLAKELEDAKTHNDRPIPKEILEAFKVPNTDSIHFIPSITARSGLARKLGPLDNEAQKLIDKESSDLPLFIHFEHVPTNFVHFSVFLNTSPVPTELKPLLGIYSNIFFTSPIIRDGKTIPFEEVVKQLEQDTVSYTIENASGLGCSELIRIRFSVEREKYETAINWVKDCIFNAQFDAERLKPTIQKMLADVPDEKRDGHSMLSSVATLVHYSTESGPRAGNTLVAALYLKRIAKLLAKTPQEVIDKFETIRKSVATSDNMRVFVTADLNKLEKPVDTWKSLVSAMTPTDKLQPLDTRRRCLSETGKTPGGKAYIVPMPTIDSSFALLTAKGLDSWTHPRLPAFAVAIQYLDAVEGPLWVAVRGTGLAYGTNFMRNLDSSLLEFSIYRSPDAFKAFKTARDVLTAFADGKSEIEDLALEGAVSSVVVGFADEQPTMLSAAAVGFVNQVIKGIPKDFSTQFLRKVRDVTKEDVRAVMKEILLPVFDAKSANLTITCATIMEEVNLHSIALVS